MIPRIQHILVPVDFTKKNDVALDMACDTAVHNQARVTLLHVIMKFEFVDEEMKDYYVRLETAADKQLERMAQRFIDAKVNVDVKVHFGSRAGEIVQCAKDHNVGLIVMSSHTIDPENLPKSLGTVSYQVAMLCQCPVMLVK